jgi:hypothetical protein
MSKIALVVPPTRIELARQRLEDVFVQIVSSAGGGAEAVSQLRAGLRHDSEGVAAV